MTRVVYFVPLVDSPQNNSSLTAKVIVLVKDCNNFANGTDNPEGWNCNHCPNDKSYYQPFIQGDLIYGQIKYDKNKYTLGSIEVIDTVTGENFANISFVTSVTGIDAVLNDYYVYVLDTANALFNDVSCFYTMMTLNGIGDELDTYVFSEPFKLVQCNEKTFLITGEYPNGYDCEGNYYGNLIQPNGKESINTYKPSFRVYGVVENDGFDFEETMNNSIKIKSQQTERFLLMTQKIPYYVAKQIAVCFNSKVTTIDEVVYQGAVKLQKNFDEGSMWIVKESIYIRCDEINFTCD